MVTNLILYSILSIFSTRMLLTLTIGLIVAWKVDLSGKASEVEVHDVTFYEFWEK